MLICYALGYGIPICNLLLVWQYPNMSLLLKKGTHPKIVQERSGHSTISVILDIYSHVASALPEAIAKRFCEALQTGIIEVAEKVG